MKSGFLSKGLAFVVAMPLPATIAACGSAVDDRAILREALDLRVGKACRRQAADFEAPIPEIGVAWKS
jgi:hypothetical protein